MQGVDPIFLKAQTPFLDNGLWSWEPILVCADRTCNAVFHEDKHGADMALKHAEFKHGWRTAAGEEDDAGE